jgi:hypothetical protein
MLLARAATRGRRTCYIDALFTLQKRYPTLFHMAFIEIGYVCKKISLELLHRAQSQSRHIPMIPHGE